MDRRKFLGMIGSISGGLIVPNSLSANIKKDELKELLGHNIDVKPKKLILSLNKIEHTLTVEEKIMTKKIIKSHFTKYDTHKDKFSDRRLIMFNPHTQESLNEIFWSEGKYHKESLAKINYFMRDFRENKTKNISLATIDGLYIISKHTKKGSPIVLNSAYRTYKTNKKIGGAKRSQHLKAKAVDFSLDKHDHTSLYSLNRFLVAHHNGGVGYYPRQKFIHIDSGHKRKWRG